MDGVPGGKFLRSWVPNGYRVYFQMGRRDLLMGSIDSVGMSRRNGSVLSVRIKMNLGVFVRIG